MTVLIVPSHLLIRQAILSHTKSRTKILELEQRELNSLKLVDEFGEALIVMDAQEDRVVFQNKVEEKLRLRFNG